jgi:hypothetical protein
MGKILLFVLEKMPSASCSVRIGQNGSIGDHVDGGTSRLMTPG